MSKYITDAIEIFSGSATENSDREDSYKENSNEKDSTEENCEQKN